MNSPFRMTCPLRAFWLAGFMLGPGCYHGLDESSLSGSGADDASADGGPDDGGTDGAGSDDEGDGPGDGREAAADDPLIRLSTDEYHHTMRDLLGATVFDAIQLELQTVPVDAEVHRGLAEVEVAHLEGYRAVAAKAAATLTEDLALFGELQLPCLQEATADQRCVRQSIERFGLRAYRRPLAAEEVDDLLAFYAEPPDHDEGLRRVMMRMLMAPQLLLHVEIDGALDDDWIALDDYAVASRLSYRLLGSMPTADLFAAAAAGELQTVAQIDAQARALLATEPAQRFVSKLFDAWVDVDALARPSAQDPVLQGLDPVELREATIEEFETFVHELVFQDEASFAELLTSSKAFPTSASLAEVYGVAPWTPGETAPTSDRKGLLQRAAALGFGTHRSAPILRGVFVLRDVMCEAIPPVDPDIVNGRLEELGNIDPLEVTTRQTIEEITKPPACQGCHMLINPIAFAMEDFDPIGRRRTTELVYGDDGTVVTEHPLDTDVEIFLADGTTQAIAGADDLSEFLSTLSQVHACFAKRVYQTTRLKVLTADDDLDLVQALVAAVGDPQLPLQEAFVTNVANEGTLWRQIGQ